MRYILFIILLFAFCNLCFGQEKNVNDDNIFYPVEKHPQFPGGETELYKFIKLKRTYPKSAQEDGIEGRVITRFVILPDGSIDNVTVLRGIHPACDSVAIEIIRSMPKWIPGTLNGKAVSTSYTLPITFPYDGGSRRVYWAPDQRASFQGTEQALFKFIAENMKYYGCSEGPCPQGRVVVRFIITKEGKIDLPKIIKGITPTLDNEALRIINLMPDWIPAKHKGETVNSYFILPIVFRLE